MAARKSNVQVDSLRHKDKRRNTPTKELGMTESEITGRLPARVKTSGDIRKGSVYKRVPYVPRIPKANGACACR